MNLLKSEFRKLVYTRPFYLYIGVSTFLSALSTISAPYSIDALKSQISGGSLLNSQLVDSIYGKATSGYLIAILLGIALMGNEYQNGQAISTFLATPKRIKVLYAKLIVAAGAGIFLMFISTGLGFIGAYFGLKHFNHAKPDVSSFVNTIIAAIISGAVLAIIGVAIGALVRNVRVASTGSMIWLAVVEKLIVLLWAAGGKFLPSGLIIGMLNLDITLKSTRKILDISTANYFGPGISIALLLLYAAVFAYIGSWVSLRRDIN